MLKIFLYFREVLASLWERALPSVHWLVTRFFLGYIKMCRHAVVFFCSEVFYEHPEITKKVNLLIRLSRRRFIYLTVDPSA